MHFSARSIALAKESSLAVLDVGCGLGVARAVKFRQVTATPYIGVDISDEAIEFNSAHSKEAGDVRYLVSDANNLKEIADSSVDVVIGSGVLHQLDTAATAQTLSRVLTPGGKALFFEPLGYNPAIGLFRKLTPKLRSADEHPLRLSDIRAYRNQFSHSSVRHFALTSLLAAPICGMENRVTDGVIAGLESVDSLFCRIPWLRILSWICVLELEKGAARPELPARN